MVIDCECMEKKLTNSGPLGTSGQAQYLCYEHNGQVRPSPGTALASPQVSPGREGPFRHPPVPANTGAEPPYPLDHYNSGPRYRRRDGPPGSTPQTSQWPGVGTSQRAYKSYKFFFFSIVIQAEVPIGRIPASREAGGSGLPTP